MRVNIYAEEMTDKIEIITKTIEGQTFTGLRFYLELPLTANLEAVANGAEPQHISGPFIHRPGDDDSAAVTFWGKRDLRKLLAKALDILHAHYEANPPPNPAVKVLKYAPKRYTWTQDGPEPPRWVAEDGTIVYRSYEDYCNG